VNALIFAVLAAAAALAYYGYSGTSEQTSNERERVLMEDLAEESAWPVFASGGIATMGDLRALEERGLAGAVIGTAMRSGALIPHVVAEEFAA
jgi:phosphoribosylformimino-5-aminoimidazole carboxamide ribonucleotide (ProFAR) isomerase